jgi:hypothetical protein
MISSMACYATKKLASISIFLFVTLSAFLLNAQKVSYTYHENIEPVIIKNCVPCHQPGQAGPFNLLTYEDVVKKGEFIGHVTKTRYMPPWKADRGFQQYRNERFLSEQEITMIQQWIAAGMPKGKPTKKTTTPLSPQKPASPDLSLKVKTPYTIPSNNVDDFRFFNLSTNLAKDQYIKKIEFIPGNTRLAHHSRLMTDTTNKVRSIDGMSANDPRISEFEKYPPVDKFLYGWVPGNFAIEFPKGTGKKIYKNSDIIANIHYSPNSRTDQTDQSTVNFYFAKDSVYREVLSLAIAEENITNPPFVIEANEKKTFYSNYGPIPVDISAIAILPHMHYLGKTFKAFAITPDGDVVMLVKIDDWDFNWQETYQFSKFLKIPKGSNIYVEASFDNTESNLANPSRPPKTITYGWGTAQEMLDLVLYFVIYKQGDELINPYD